MFHSSITLRRLIIIAILIFLCLSTTCTRAVAAWSKPASNHKDAPPPRDLSRQLTSSLPTSPLQLQLSPESTGHYAAHRHQVVDNNSDNAAEPIDVLAEMRQSLNVMQTFWFELWLGTWPTSIDWTAAVLNTHLVASLGTISSSGQRLVGSRDERHRQEAENELNLFFSQTIAYHFNENAFSIRNQAYDDMSWVTLGWLESIKFIRAHNSTLSDPWHGLQFVDVFAHRARVFYDLITKGWDTELCGGGMVWSPSLGPYKNAITNQLYVSASVDMYLHHPGDANESPFFFAAPTTDSGEGTFDRAKPQDPAYLTAAIQGYDWLKHSNMTNSLGLYVDGFHITGWKRNSSLGTKKCDARNEQVFTYNQAVVLSGLRGLWESTGNTSYLEDGHELIRNSIAATGWSLDSHTVVLDGEPVGQWRGLGRNGVLEDRCDSRGTCDQNSHTFKGIFFHHLARFCQPLPLGPLIPDKTFGASKELEWLHRQSCKFYAPWVAHNARAALSSRDGNGKYGCWWGARWYRSGEVEHAPAVKGAVDYRNDESVLAREPWLGRGYVAEPTAFAGRSEPELVTLRLEHQECEPGRHDCDPNDRGRGRTVESHSGGLAVLRCLLELESLA
ncbi:hypothetical protein MBLNU230_g3460t1 [Neophaeotheca triangularis]